MEVPLALKNELKAIQLEWEIIVNKMSQGVTEGWDSCIGERSWSIDTQPEEAKKKKKNQPTFDPTEPRQDGRVLCTSLSGRSRSVPNNDRLDWVAGLFKWL